MAPSSTDRSDRHRGIIPLYSTPRRLHQQQHLAWLQSSESGGKPRSGPRVCLLSLAHPLAPSQQRRTSKPSSAAAPAKHPSPLLPTRPVSSRRQLDARPGSAAPDPPPPPRAPARARGRFASPHARVGLSPAVPRGLRWTPVPCPVGAAVVALGACEVLPLRSPSRVSVCGPPSS
ncbi:hypothetical protein GQ55_3G346700 [Panicum hallii var. hallii]|uniref:Uncharacterized protein n=1 Tax=Panicum hallii var. hallii TaxID=1504633 RepID=A0A2T7EFR1_9POAL|nr:hypothetical protein GQ55_3G346700 [Panicum hallii var. hallii]